MNEIYIFGKNRCIVCGCDDSDDGLEHRHIIPLSANKVVS